MTDGGGDVDVAVRGVQGRVGRGVGSLGRMREGAARICVDDGIALQVRQAKGTDSTQLGSIKFVGVEC